MNRCLLTAVLFFLTAAAAWAQFNGCKPGFCPSIFGGGGTITPPPTGALLLEDGTSILLLEDGSSSLCLEGGC